MATLGLKGMGKFFQTQGSHRKIHWENAKKKSYEKWVERHASFPPRQSVKPIWACHVQWMLYISYP